MANEQSLKEGLKELVSDALEGNAIKKCELELQDGTVVLFDLAIHVKEIRLANNKLG